MPDQGPEPPSTPARANDPGTPATPMANPSSNMRTPAIAKASPSSNMRTPVKLVKIVTLEQEPQTPRTSGSNQTQTTLNFAKRPRSSLDRQCPEESEMSLVPVTDSHENTVCKVPALQALLDKVSADPENSSLVEAVVQEQTKVYESSLKRKPGQLAPLPLNLGGKKATREDCLRTGRPADPKGKRVGRGGYLTPDQSKNTRPAEQVVLRRDCTAPSRLRMALAVQAAGAKKPSDLKNILPETWRLLTVRFARPNQFTN